MAARIFHDNRFADGTPVASTTATDTAAANLTDWKPFTFWKPTALPATVTVDCGSAKAFNSTFIYRHDLATQGATLETRGSTDNFSASNVLIDTVTPTSNAAIARVYSAQSYRYVRLRLTGTTMPSIAIAAIGTYLDLQGDLTFDEFDPLGYRIVGQANRNENGQPLGKVIDFAERSASITLHMVTWSWLRNTFKPTWDASLRATPFGFQWDAASDPVPWLVVAGDELRTPHYPNGQADVSFDISGVAD